MEASRRGHARLTFGPFEFDTDTMELLRDGAHVHLPPKPSRALQCLLASAGSLVTRQELQDHVWPDTVIEFDQGLNTCMRHLRATLGDDADRPTYIETVPRRGYRFIAPVTNADAVASRGPRTRRWSFLLAAAAGVLLTVWLAPGDASAPAPLRLAVLPFEAIGGTADDSLFAEGMTEELLTTMAGADPARVRVLARTSAYRLARGFTLADMRDGWEIDLVLQGRVRPEPGGYKITTQLVDTRTSVAQWTGEHRYATELGSVPAQEALARGVAEGLSVRLGMPLDLPASERPASHLSTAWRVANHLVASGDDSQRERALVLLRQVIDEDPDFAPAHAARARSLIDLGRLEEAEAHLAAADRDLVPKILLERGRLHLRRWRLDDAGRDLHAAVAAAPQDARAYHALGYYLSVTGQHEKALRAMAVAREFDPVSASVVGDAGLFASWAGEPAETIRQCEAVRPYVLPEHALMVTRCLLHGHAANGEWPEALGYARVVLEAGEAEDDVIAAVDVGPSAERSMRRYFAWAAEPANLGVSQGGASSYREALAHAGAGSLERALSSLEQALAEREPRLIEIGVEPRLDPLRDQPRFDAILQTVGLDPADRPTDAREARAGALR